METKQIIGWKETIDLPELGIFNVDVKIDTGARTSVLHCNAIRPCIIDGLLYVECELITDFKNNSSSTFTLPVVKEKKIKNSFGQQEERFLIRTTARLFGQDHPIRLTFRDRSAMEYPMLLGRNFIKNKFLVDVSLENLSKQ